MKKILAVFAILATISCEKDLSELDKVSPSFSDPVAELPVDTLTETDSEDSTGSVSNVEMLWQTFTILKGNNFNEGTNYANLDHDSIRFAFSFDESAIYTTSERENQADWNKLAGFSDCGSFHQQNSVRMVWRWSPELQLIELGGYYYRGGKVGYSKIHEIAIGDTASALIYVTDSTYNIEVANLVFSETRRCKNRQNRYMLMPYFGGNEPAPHNIDVHFKLLYPEMIL